MGVGQSERPIFLDTSGKRWKVLKLFFVFGLLSVGGAAGLLVYHILRLPPPPQSVSAALPANTSQVTTPPTQSVNQLYASISMTNVPVIGSGPFVRVVKLENRVTKDPFTASTGRSLTSDEVLEVGSHPYAFERYGGSKSGRRLVLTYDDGPDPVYTPQILDTLARGHAPATFFVVGGEAIRYPEIMQRIVREGHSVGNHSFTHANFEGVPVSVAVQEINLTARTIRATTSRDTILFRPPYAGSSDQSLRDATRSILDAQKMGYVAALYDFDSEDWRHPHDAAHIPMPLFDGADHVVLLHDGGGDRTATVAYTQKLIEEAKKRGYSFVTLAGLYPTQPAYFRSVQPSMEDTAFATAGRAVMVWPARIMRLLFTITVVLVFLGTAIYTVLAVIQKRRAKKYLQLVKSSYRPGVAIVVPAYNEERVLRNCVRSLLRSDYHPITIYIVDDGSTDNTFGVAQKLARQYKNVRALHKPNGGKSSALNYAIRRTRAQIIIGIDADTQFLPDSVARLVRHFEDPTVGAVAGLVRVGNRINTIARCQALEYATSISLDRSAQALLGAIMVVPGACGAWRRKAVFDAGGYSPATLAEDCDLTIAVHIAGYNVLQDNTAVGLTEVPASIRSFAKQRFRWTYGNLQVYWKYQDILFSSRYGWLDSFVLPMAILASVGPLIFLPLLTVIAISNLLNGQYMTIVVFASIAFVFQFVRSWIALVLAEEKLHYLLLVPVARLIYGPLRIYLIYGTLFRAMRGAPVGWGKLARFGMLFQATPPTELKPVSVKAPALSQAGH